MRSIPNLREMLRVLDLILKLLDRLIDLAYRRNQENRKLFEDFVSPAFKDFEKVHAHYIESFQSYRDLLNKSRKALDASHPILDQVRTSRIYSHQLVANMWALELMAADKIIGPFLRSMLDYSYGYVIKEDAKRLRAHLYQISVHRRKSMLYGLKKEETPTEIDAEVFETELAQYIGYEYMNFLRKMIESDLPRKQVKKELIQEADAIAARLQGAYTNVVREYNKLKAELLRPI